MQILLNGKHLGDYFLADSSQTVPLVPSSRWTELHFLMWVTETWFKYHDQTYIHHCTFNSKKTQMQPKGKALRLKAFNCGPFLVVRKNNCHKKWMCTSLLSSSTSHFESKYYWKTMFCKCIVQCWIINRLQKTTAVNIRKNPSKLLNAPFKIIVLNSFSFWQCNLKLDS